MAPSKLQPALLGGAFIGVLSALPIISAGNLCCCLWVIAGGVLASYIMQQNHPAPITAGDGAIAGLLAGVFGAVVYVAVAAPITLVTGPFQRQMLDAIMERSHDMPDQFRDALQNVGVGAGGLVIGFAFMLVVGVIFATVGGIVGAVIFARNPPPAPPAPGEPGPV